jgi:hypothetical protein
VNKKRRKKMPKYKITIEEEFTIEAENEDDAVFQALDGFDFGNVKPYVEEIEEENNDTTNK